MRLLVTGSRTWTGRWGEQRIGEVLDKVHALAKATSQVLIVTHGDAKGADRVADTWARHRVGDGVEVVAIPANWSVGARAGPIRNQRMVDMGHDICVGFVRGVSPGTQSCLAFARNAGIFTLTVYWEESETDGA